MIAHDQDAFATLLLVSDMEPGRGELAEPLTTAQWRAFSRLLKARGYAPGDLVEMDMSGLMLRLGLSEAEAYRLCLLLGRTLPLSVSLEEFAARGVDVTTIGEKQYPPRVRERMGEKAPPALYMAGRPEVFWQDAVAILGGPPPDDATEQAARSLAAAAVRAGYVVLTEGLTGVARVAEDEALDRGGLIAEVLPGHLAKRAQSPDMALILKERAGACLSQRHPDAPGDVKSALAREKLIFALADAVFVVSADNLRGAAYEGALEALKTQAKRFIYVWNDPGKPGNIDLIARGATPFCPGDAFEPLAQGWRGATQLSMFDRAEPLA